MKLEKTRLIKNVSYNIGSYWIGGDNYYIDTKVYEQFSYNWLYVPAYSYKSISIERYAILFKKFVMMKVLYNK